MKRLSDEERPNDSSARIVLPEEVGIFVTSGTFGSSVRCCTSRFGGSREAVGRGIWDDIRKDRIGSRTTREEIAQVWAESLFTDNLASEILLSAINYHLRDCATDGQKWAQDALEGFRS
jgi:hypothetical protein